MEEKIYYLGFSLFPGIGSVLFSKLLTHFGSVEKAWKSREKEMQGIVGDKLTEKFLAFRKTVHLAEELEKITQKNIQLVTLGDKEYPEILRKIGSSVILASETRPESIKEGFWSSQDDTKSSSHIHSNNSKVPFLLYVKGDVSILSAPKTIGIVGTRKITPYGREVTTMLTTELVQAGFVVVSGLAFGVDSAAHMATVKNNGRTIAVLGGGVDVCYPRENQPIYGEILSHGGAIISAFPVGMEPTKGTFPARNALIAGLSQGIVVTEGAQGSGSLITANYAKKFGRPVFTVPGPITSSLSKGANGLLKDGGIAVTSAKDILDNLGIMSFQKAQKFRESDFSDNPDELIVLKLLENGPLHFDEIVRTIGKDSKSIGSLLSLMELSGLIHQQEGKYYL